jgi:hypothetical protein
MASNWHPSKFSSFSNSVPLGNKGLSDWVVFSNKQTRVGRILATEIEFTPKNVLLQHDDD